MKKKDNFTSLPVKKWDKESLLTLLEEQYCKLVRGILKDDKLSYEEKKFRLDLVFNIFYPMYEPVINDRITYKKIEKKNKK